MKAFHPRFGKILDLPLSFCLFDVAWPVTLYFILENKVELSFFQLLIDVFSEISPKTQSDRLKSHRMYTYCKSSITVRITKSQDKNLPGNIQRFMQKMAVLFVLRRITKADDKTLPRSELGETNGEENRKHPA